MAPPCDLPRCNHAGEARAPDQRRLAFGSRLAKECRRQPSCNPTWKLAIPAQYRSAGGTVASGDQDLGALHLEAGTPHTAFTIGPFEPFSSPSEWNQPPLWYSSVTPSARRQQCLLWPSAIVVPPSPVCGNRLTIMRPAVAELTSARQPVQVARESPRTWGLDGYVAPRAARNWSSITFSPALTCSAPNPMKPPSFAASAAACTSNATDVSSSSWLGGSVADRRDAIVSLVSSIGPPGSAIEIAKPATNGARRIRIHSSSVKSFLDVMATSLGARYQPRRGSALPCQPTSRASIRGGSGIGWTATGCAAAGRRLGIGSGAVGTVLGAAIS